MKPDAKNHNPDRDYLRGLIEAAGVSTREAARRCGVKEHTMRAFLADGPNFRECPYSVQFCLENLKEEETK
jgi:hypothetical protein